MKKISEALKRMLTKEALFAIILLSLVLRFIVINQSLWLDEAIGALIAKSHSYQEIVLKFPLADNHPPLYYLALKGWTDIFGYSEVALRSLSVLFGTLTVIFVYKVADLISKKKKIVFPLASALFLATSPLHIYYSQEARMYAMAGFLGVAAIYYFLKTIKGKEKYTDWILFCLFYTSLIFTDYVPAFLYPVFPLYALLKKKGRGWWGRFVLANVPLLVLWYFWLPIFLIQSQRGGWLLKTLPAWQTVAGGATIKQAALVWTKFTLGRISFVNKTLYYLLVGLSSIPFIVVFYKSIVRAKERFSILNLWLFVPLFLGFAASFWFPAFIYFRFIFVLPAFYLLAAKGVDMARGIDKLILISLLLAVNLIGWAIYVSDKNQQRENWRGAVDFIEERAKKEDVVIFENPEPFAPYRWYEAGVVEAVGVTDSISANKEETRKITRGAIEDKEGVYYFPYLSDLADPDGYVLDVVEKDFKLEGEFSYHGLGQIKYFVRR